MTLSLDLDWLDNLHRLDLNQDDLDLDYFWLSVAPGLQEAAAERFDQAFTERYNIEREKRVA